MSLWSHSSSPLFLHVCLFPCPFFLVFGLSLSYVTICLPQTCLSCHPLCIWLPLILSLSLCHTFTPCLPLKLRHICVCVHLCTYTAEGCLHGKGRRRQTWPCAFLSKPPALAPSHFSRPLALRLLSAVKKEITAFRRQSRLYWARKQHKGDNFTRKELVRRHPLRDSPPQTVPRASPSPNCNPEPLLLQLHMAWPSSPPSGKCCHFVMTPQLPACTQQALPCSPGCAFSNSGVNTCMEPLASFHQEPTVCVMLIF